MRFLFYTTLTLILWHNVFYWLILFFFAIFLKKPEVKNKNEDYLPFVSLIIAFHNEEKVLEKKILDALSLDYPDHKISIIFVSDNSTDMSDEIVSKYSEKYNRIKLLKVEKRGGKVNAYNEAYKIAKGEILAFSDANTMWNKDALKKLIQPLLNKNDISCVCGHLTYINKDESEIAFSESLYWRLENMMKDLESKLYSLTALNGGIYAIRREDYIFIEPLYSHDLCLPLLLGSKKKRTIFVKEAIAFERSGTTAEDEVKRKRRMFGRIYSFLFENLSLFFNPLKYNFIYFIEVFSHRTIRYALPFLHILLFGLSIFLFPYGIVFKIVFFAHLLFITLSVIGFFSRRKVKIFFLPYYYIIFMKSLLLGYIDYITGKIKPYWDVAETTRE